MQRQFLRDHAAQRCSDDVSRSETRMLHDRDDVPGHLRDSVGAVRCAATTCAAVVHDERQVILSEVAVDAIPSANRAGKSAQQHERWPGCTANLVIDYGTPRS